MPNYYNTITEEIVDLQQELIDAWESSGNPKFQEYIPVPLKPSPNSIWQNNQWVLMPSPAITAEEHLIETGYSPLRLLTCLDLENKLRSSNLISNPLAAVRQWIDNLTLSAAINPDEKRSDWPLPPYPFEIVISDSISKYLNQ